MLSDPTLLVVALLVKHAHYRFNRRASVFWGVGGWVGGQ